MPHLAPAVAGAAVLAATVAVALRRTLVVVGVVGHSMQPTYHDGDRVLVRKSTSPARGAVVVLQRPDHLARPPGRDADDNWMLKRVVALPGDPMSAQVARAGGLDELAPVPAGHVVVQGDNAAASYDSRQCGPVPSASLLGVVLRSMGSVRGRPPRISGDRREAAVNVREGFRR